LWVGDSCATAGPTEGTAANIRMQSDHDRIDCAEYVVAATAVTTNRLKAYMSASPC
jgi:hypothetical protein